MAGKKVSNSLVALSSAAILAVYAAGYHRTTAAANRLEVHSGRHRTSAPIVLAAVTAPAMPVKVDAPRKVLVPAAKPLKTAPSQSSRTATPNATVAALPTRIIDSPIAPVDTPVPPPVTAAPVAKPVEQPSAASAKPQYKDGTYSGWGSCRHGDIEASVVIQGGNIVSADITQCLTRYSCSWIDALPGQVVTRQNANVDSVSGASQSADAYSDAVSSALTKASE